jgi:hypothetical protein
MQAAVQKEKEFVFLGEGCDNAQYSAWAPHKGTRKFLSEGRCQRTGADAP